MRHTVTALLLTLGLLGAWTPGFAQEQGKPHRIVIASGPLGGSFYLSAGAVCMQVNKTTAKHGLECLVLPGGNSEENLARLEAGDVNFALVQSDWQYRARLANAGPNGVFTDLRSVLSLHAWAVTLVAAPESGITQPADLLGRRVSFGPSGSIGDFAGQALITLMGWQSSDFAEVVDMPLHALPSALCEGRIDALVLPLVHPDPSLANLLEACQAELIDLASGGLEKISLAWPFMDRVTLNSSLYDGLTLPVESFGLRAGLMTTAAEPAEVVAAVTEAVLSEFEAFKSSYPLFLGLTARRAVHAAVTAPLHDGVEAFIDSGRLSP
jgi:TRAP transporter TAXI family solute receptor